MTVSRSQCSYGQHIGEETRVMAAAAAAVPEVVPVLTVLDLVSLYDTLAYEIYGLVYGPITATGTKSPRPPTTVLSKRLRILVTQSQPLTGNRTSGDHFADDSIAGKQVRTRACRAWNACGPSSRTGHARRTRKTSSCGGSRGKTHRRKKRPSHTGRRREQRALDSGASGGEKEAMISL